MDSLLELIRNRGTISTPELAELMSSSPEMIEARLEFYARSGYLRKTVFAAAGCASGCDHCGGCGGNRRLSHPIVFWEVIKR